MTSSNTTTTDYDGLPSNVKPIHYNLHLDDLVLREPWTFRGYVVIELEILSASNSITLHANELQLEEADLSYHRPGKDGQYEKLAATKFEHDTRNQRCTIIFPSAFHVPTEPTRAILSIHYQGTMNDHLTGFYRSAYQVPAGTSTTAPLVDGSRYMFSTQFQPIDARRALPCFDEPGLKASFGLSVTIPRSLQALSNMPVSASIDNHGGDTRTVYFERSPRMSTYLFAWAIGDFEYVEKVVARRNGPDLPIRVYTTKGLKQHADYGLDVGAKVVDYFSEIFRIEYPLPKLDMIAVHEMADDAMENWGLLTFQSTALLYNPATSSPSYKTHVAYIVAHELAHQWFGNLVTPHWWDELWLNEGFATWAGWQAVDHLHPEWDVWAEFVGDSMQGAFRLDALRASHPVQVSVRSDLEVDSIFDAISYKKGSSLVRMLAIFLGQGRFVEGVARYLAKHAYGCTRGSDLWRELSAVSGLDVAAFMHNWIQLRGFPVISMEDVEPSKLRVRQQQFVTSGESALGAGEEPIWWIPIQPRSGSSTGKDSVSAEPLTERDSHLELSGTDLLTMNSGQAGYYRLSRPAQHLELLSTQLDKLSISEQIGLICDLSALAAAGHDTTNTGTLLSYLRHFRHQSNKHVWEAMLSSTSYIESIFTSVSSPELARGLNRYILDLTSPILSTALNHQNFFSPSETLDADLQDLLLQETGLAGHAEILSQAANLTPAFLSGDSTTPLPPSLRSSAFALYVHAGGEAAAKKIQEAYVATTTSTSSDSSSLDLGEILLHSLGHVSTPSLAREVMAFAFEKVDTQNLAHVVDGFAENADAGVRFAVWEFVKENFEGVVLRRLEGSVVVLDRLLQGVLEMLVVNREEEERGVKGFFEEKDLTGFGRGVRVGLEMLEGNGRYRVRDEGVLMEWLRREGYLQ